MKRKTLILSARNWQNTVSMHHIFEFENEVAKRLNIGILGPSKLVFTFARILDISSKLIGIKSKWMPVPSPLYFKANKYQLILVCLNGVIEISPTLNTMPLKGKKIILYIIDAWQPLLEELSDIINEYQIDVILCAYLQAAEYLRKKHGHVYWFPMGFNDRIYRDYGLRKKFKVIQFGLKHPILHRFFLNFCNENEYIYHFIKGDKNLARHINQSRFFAVSPRNLVLPEVTGHISPVTLRYYQGMACKAMPVGFKPQSKEFDLLFPEVSMIEYKDDKQFRDELNWYLQNDEEYREIIKRNYEAMHRKHTHRKRVEELIAILEKEGLI